MRYVALLRGVNVGGNNKLPMKDLAAIFDWAGCENIQTYIQSGNVVFSANAKTASTLPSSICTRITSQFGFRTCIILRSQAEMAKVAASNPFLDSERCHVMFLESAPPAEGLAQLDPARSSPDEFKIVGRDIYLYLPNGMARTKLTNAYFDSKLKTVSTARNWNTVLRLLAMMQA